MKLAATPAAGSTIDGIRRDRCRAERYERAWPSRCNNSIAVRCRGYQTLPIQDKSHTADPTRLLADSSLRAEFYAADLGPISL